MDANEDILVRLDRIIEKLNEVISILSEKHSFAYEYKADDFTG